jgi:hypothetical protein
MTVGQRLATNGPLVIAVALIVCAVGCATTPQPSGSRAMRPVSEATRARIAAVAVHPVEPGDAPNVDTPLGKGTAMAAGAGAGAAAPLMAGLYMAPETLGLSLIVGVFLAPVGAVVGGTVGLIGGANESEVKAQVERVNDGLKDVHPWASIGAKVAMAAAGEARLRTRLVSNATPALARDEVRLELAVTGYGLRGPTDMNPDLRLFITLDGQLVDAAGTVIDRRTWDRQGAPRKLKEWAELGPGVIESEFARLEQDLVQAATAELFTTVVVP